MDGKVICEVCREYVVVEVGVEIDGYEEEYLRGNDGFVKVEEFVFLRFFGS